jgi:hypothetical protein
LQLQLFPSDHISSFSIFFPLSRQLSGCKQPAPWNQVPDKSLISSSAAYVKLKDRLASQKASHKAARKELIACQLRLEHQEVWLAEARSEATRAKEECEKNAEARAVAEGNADALTIYVEGLSSELDSLKAQHASEIASLSAELEALRSRLAACEAASPVEPLPTWQVHLGCQDGEMTVAPFVQVAGDLDATYWCYADPTNRMRCHHLFCSIEDGQLQVRGRREKRLPGRK